MRIIVYKIGASILMLLSARFKNFSGRETRVCPLPDFRAYYFRDQIREGRAQLIAKGMYHNTERWWQHVIDFVAIKQEMFRFPAFGIALRLREEPLTTEGPRE